MLKACTRCGIEKSSLEFNWRNKAKGLKQSHCRLCHNTANRAHWARNREAYAVSNKKNRDRNREFVLRYLLEHPCVDCGESDPVVLEFDHVRGEKRAAIGAMLNTNYSIAAFEAEIAKCEVRCANCHRRKTACQFGWWEDLKELMNV